MSAHKQVTPKWRPSRKRWVVDTRSRGVVKHDGNAKGGVEFFETKDAALAAAALVNAAQATGGVITDAESGTLEAAFVIFKARVEARRDEKKSICPRYARTLINDARVWLFDGDEPRDTAKLKCKSITSADLIAIIEDAGWSVDNARKKRAALRGVFQAAEDQKWCLPANRPTESVHLENSKYDKTELEIEDDAAAERQMIAAFEPANIRSIYEHAIATHDVPVVDKDGSVLRQAGCIGLTMMFAALTGLRWGEQAALKWKNVDLDRRRVNVMTSMRWADGGSWEVNVPKRTASVRTVPLTHDLVAALKAWKLRSPASAAEDRVFMGARGEPLTSSSYHLRLLHHSCDAVDSIRIRWHWLRHFYASVLVDAYRPSSDKNDLSNDRTWNKISRLMGHANVQITFKHYVHYLDDCEADEELADVLEAQMNRR